MSENSRPKSTRYVPLKIPDDLLAAIQWNCRKFKSPKSVGDWIKDACEFRLYIILGMRYGLYDLMTSFPEIQQELGNTNGRKVTPKS